MNYLIVNIERNQLFAIDPLPPRLILKSVVFWLTVLHYLQKSDYLGTFPERVFTLLLGGSSATSNVSLYRPAMRNSFSILFIRT